MSAWPGDTDTNSSDKPPIYARDVSFEVRARVVMRVELRKTPLMLAARALEKLAKETTVNIGDNVTINEINTLRILEIRLDE